MRTYVWRPPVDWEFRRSAFEAWNDPKTRRMTLPQLRMFHNGKQRKIAKALGISVFVYYRYELGKEPVSRELLEKVAAILDAPAAQLEFILRVTDDALMMVQEHERRERRRSATAADLSELLPM